MERDEIFEMVHKYNGAIIEPACLKLRSDIVIGILSEFLQKFYTVSVHEGRKLSEERAIHITSCEGCEKCEEFEQRQHVISRMMDIFWACVRGETGNYTDCGIGIRKGWQIVTYECPHDRGEDQTV